MLISINILLFFIVISIQFLKISSNNQVNDTLSYSICNISTLNSIPKELKCECASNISNNEKDSILNYLTFQYCIFSSTKLMTMLGISLLSIWLLFLFYIIAGTADDYMIPSLTKGVDMLKISPHIAGVTILAFANGAPDLFTSIAAFSGNNKENNNNNEDHDDNDLGIGALLGAGMFVTSFTLGAVAFRSIQSKDKSKIRSNRNSFRIAKRPFLRDSITYLCGICFLFYLYLQGQVYLYQALCMISFYIIYVIIVIFGRHINQKYFNVKGTKNIEKSINNQKTMAIVRNSQNKPDHNLINNNNLDNKNAKTVPFQESLPDLIPCTIRNFHYPLNETPCNTVPMNITVSLTPPRKSINNTTNYIKKNVDEEDENNEEERVESIPDVQEFSEILRYSLSKSLKKHPEENNSNSCLDVSTSITPSPYLPDTPPLSQNLITENYVHCLNDDLSENQTIKYRLLNRIYNWFSFITDCKNKNLLGKILSIPEIPFTLARRLTIPLIPSKNNENDHEMKHDEEKDVLAHTTSNSCDYSSYSNSVIDEINLPNQRKYEFIFLYLSIIIGPQFALYVTLPTISWVISILTFIIFSSISLCFYRYNEIKKRTLDTTMNKVSTNAIKNQNKKCFNKKVIDLLIIISGFIISCVWTYLIAQEIVQVMHTIGLALGISSSMLGVTVLALGNSIGDFISNLSLAKKGYSRMAVAECFGGPIFNTLIGIGASLLIATIQQYPKPKSLLSKESSQNKIAAYGFLMIISSVIGTIFLVVFVLKFRLNKLFGLGLMIVYLVFLTIIILAETNLLPYLF